MIHQSLMVLMLISHTVRHEIPDVVKEKIQQIKIQAYIRKDDTEALVQIRKLVVQLESEIEKADAKHTSEEV